VKLELLLELKIEQKNGDGSNYMHFKTSPYIDISDLNLGDDLVFL
jgi:hypothetical protein